MLHLKNPHSVLAALERRPQDVLKITLARAAREAAENDPWARVVQLARKHRIPVIEGGHGAPSRDPRSERGKAEGGRVSGTEAEVRDQKGVTAEELFRDAPQRAGGKGLWIALDSLQDPQNVGAIFRTAAFFGVQGILMTEERSAPLSSAAYDVASGGIDAIPFTLQTNLQRGFEVAKEAGLWIIGTSEHGKEDFRKLEPDRPWLLVLGNEEKGMRRLTQEACDVLYSIPCRGDVTSLNVSVAAGIFISKLTAIG